jgi:hypothetical protein
MSIASIAKFSTVQYNESMKELSQRKREAAIKFWSLPDNHTKARRRQLGKNNSNWKGDDVNYIGLHLWVRSRKKKSKSCQNCKKKPPMDLANIGGKYTRDLDNWEYLCRKCHMIKDGRLEKFILSGRRTSFCTKEYMREYWRKYREKNKEYLKAKRIERAKKKLTLLS